MSCWSDNISLLDISGNARSVLIDRSPALCRTVRGPLLLNKQVRWRHRPPPPAACLPSFITIDNTALNSLEPTGVPLLHRKSEFLPFECVLRIGITGQKNILTNALLCPSWRPSNPLLPWSSRPQLMPHSAAQLLPGVLNPPSHLLAAHPLQKIRAGIGQADRQADRRTNQPVSTDPCGPW